MTLKAWGLRIRKELLLRFQQCMKVITMQPDDIILRSGALLALRAPQKIHFQLFEEAFKVYGENCKLQGAALEHSSDDGICRDVPDLSHGCKA